MKYIESSNRRQLNLIPECLDDYVEGNNEVKIIEAFVEKMSEKKGLEQMGFNRSGELRSSQGRPQYSCEILLKLYIYGYLHHIRSSRKLEWLSRTNIELKWLLGNLHPDHKTISDFRRENKKGIRSFFKMLILFLRDNDLVDGKIVAYDGCKIKANTSKGMYSIKKLDKRLKEIEKEIEEYLDSIEKTDIKESK
jgi:transposase